MLTLYKPGNGRLHRMRAGPKILLLLAVLIGVLLLPTVWWAALVAAGVVVVAYAAAQLSDGLRELGRQVVALRWLVAILAVSQLVFLGPEPALANTTRVVAAVVLAGLLCLTTRMSDLLAAVERGLEPLRRVRIDPQQVALLLAVTLSTIPVLAQLARDVREAQRARGARGSLRTVVVPFLVLALKHADQLGDALTGRGVR